MSVFIRKISRLLTNRYFLRVIGIIIGLIFIYACIDKIQRPDLFAEIVYEYDILPMLAVNPFTLAMPALELTAGLLLILGFWRRSAALILALLTVMFLIAIASVEMRGLEIACGCFEVGDMHATEAGWNLFIRDIPLLFGCLLIWRKG